MDKKILRKEILDKKAKLGDSLISDYSTKIIDKLMDSDFYKKARKIMIYISFGTEIHTHEFIKRSLELNKEIYVPITNPKTKEIKPSQLKDFSELELGFYNILTPKAEFTRYIDPKVIDLVIVPGVVFDKSGYRIGYGGGYYDRFLPRLDKDVPKIALAFHMQLMDKVPRETFDIPVDYIITEKDIMQC